MTMAGGLLVAAIATFALFILASIRAVTRLSARVDELGMAVRELQADRAHLNGELDRVDDLLERADKISTRVESTSRFAYNTLAAPVIKAWAVGKGTGQAARSLRHRSEKT